MVAEGEVLELRAKLREAEQDAHRAREATKAAQAEREQLRMRVRELEARRTKGHGPVQHQQQEVVTAGGSWEGDGDRTGGGEGLQYLFRGAQEWRLQAEAAKG